MKLQLTIVALLIALSPCYGETRKLVMSLDDEFIVQDTAKWTVSVQRSMDLRLADVLVEPKRGASFSLMLYFKCDTKDLAHYNTPEKMKIAVLASSEKYIDASVEKEVKLEEISNRGWYGFRARFTDASLVNKKPIPEGQFLYIIRGMIRLSEESALGFSLMTNDPNSPETKEIEKYVYSFAKKKT